MAAYLNEEIQNSLWNACCFKFVQKKYKKISVWACGEAGVQDKQGVKASCQSCVLIQQWAHSIQMSKVLEEASGCLVRWWWTKGNGEKREYEDRIERDRNEISD